MALLSRVKTWLVHECLNAKDLNAEFDSLLQGTNEALSLAKRLEQERAYPSWLKPDPPQPVKKSRGLLGYV